MKKSLIVDGNSIINRAFYAIKNMSTRDGIPTGALYGFINILDGVMQELKPDYAVVCFDMRKPTFRHLEYEEYKAGRKKTPDELVMQIAGIKEILCAQNIKVEELEGFEADDLLGIISHEFEKHNIFSYVLSGDKDALQLVGDMTNVYYHGTKNRIIYDEKEVLEDMGVLPNRVADLKGLMGDTSDNIPGIKGIGRVQAIKLLNEFDNVENIITSVNEISNARTRTLVQEGADMAVLSKRLATIVRSAGVDVDISEYEIIPPNYIELAKLYKRYSLKKFLNKIIGKISVDESLNYTNDEQEQDIVKIIPEKLDELVIDSQNRDQISLFDMDEKSNSNQTKSDSTNDNKNIDEDKVDSSDITVSQNNSENYIDKLSKIDFTKPVVIYPLYDNDDIFDMRFEYLVISNALDITITLNSKHKTDGSATNTNQVKNALEYIESALKGNPLKLISHDIKPFMIILKNYQDINIKIQPVFDTKIAMYLLSPNMSDYNLDNLALDYLGSYLIGEEQLIGKGKSQIKYSDLNEWAAFNYLNQVADVINSGVITLTERLKTDELYNLYIDLELPLVQILADMQYEGFNIDKSVLKSMQELVNKKLINLESEVYALAGKSFNLNSPKQLSTVLFEDLKLPIIKKTSTSISTSHEVLVKLLGQHEIIEKIIDYRMYSKLYSTYILGLQVVINPKSHKIHSNLNQTVVATGRLSSTEPNLQNIPVRLEIGRELRKVFVASPGNTLVDADYSQIELRVLAHMSQDPVLLKAYHENIDIHKMTASQIFDIPLDEVSNDQRNRAKTINFGIIYGMSDFGLSENLKISVSEAKKYIENYFIKYPKIKEFMDNCISDCKQRGYSTTLLGRRRMVPEINSKNYNIRQYGERIAMNTPIQGTAADIIKLAMIAVYNGLKSGNYKSKLILQVHDELIIDAHPDELEEVKILMKDAMNSAFEMSIPLKVDLNSGNSWYDAK